VNSDAKQTEGGKGRGVQGRACGRKTKKRSNIWAGQDVYRSEKRPWAIRKRGNNRGGTKMPSNYRGGAKGIVDERNKG